MTATILDPTVYQENLEKNSVPGTSDKCSYLLDTLVHYVERSPVRASLIKLAEQWQWGSAWQRQQQNSKQATWLNPGYHDVSERW